MNLNAEGVFTEALIDVATSTLADPIFERIVFGAANKLCDEYSGGSWDAYQVTFKRPVNDGKLEEVKAGQYFVPTSLPDKVTATSFGFQQDIELTPKALGLAVTLTALSHYSFHLHGSDSPRLKNVTDSYHWLFFYLRDTSNFSDDEKQAISMLLD